MPDKTTPSERITQEIEALDDWRGERLASLRELVLTAGPDIEEAWKWGSATWMHHGLLCSAGVFKQHVRLTFFKGIHVPDPDGLFNAAQDAKEMRAINFHEGDRVDASALQELVRAAADYNAAGG